ncbi:MAG: hemin ABC transporter substrate-binding protein [Alphaproteobacteria bacterium]
MRVAIRALAALAVLGIVAAFPRPSLAADDAAAETTRVVSIGGALTEIVYALGAEDALVAVDSTSFYPEKARDLPNVGYMRQLSAEPVVALQPTLVLAIEDSGPPQALEQMRAAGLNLQVIKDDPTPEGVIAKVAAVAQALGKEAEGEALAAKLRAEFDAVLKQVAGLPERPSVIFFFSLGSGTPLAGGRDTAPDGIIALAGGRNAFDAFEGFKPLSPEAAVASAPDVVLVTEQTLKALGGRDKLIARPEIAATPAGREGRVVAMDALLLLGFGPRTPEAIRTLAEALHPAQRTSATTE